MEKNIHLKDGNNIEISSSSDYVNTFCFKKNYFKAGRIYKSICFYIWDDISFNAYVEEGYQDNFVEFEFNKKDPIFKSIGNFLGNDNVFIIDDDNTSEINKKYLIFMRDRNNYKVRFVNDNWCKDHIIYNRFNVFIKNIGPDSRSKIKDSDTKFRIVDFLRDIEDNLMNNDYNDKHVKIKRM